jgi:hypothetical protein
MMAAALRGAALALLLALGLAPAAGAAPPSPAGAPPALRVAVLVGANAAAPGRKPLLYSYQDVDRMSQVLQAVGGFRKEDVFLLRDPSPGGLVGALTAAVARMRDRPESLLYFYYSGHADERALYPGGQPVALERLRALIDGAQVSVKIGVVDACRGGSWTRAKGLSPEEPFAVKWPVNLDAEGSVLIASSSGLEAAHESDQLQGSFFTYHFTAGLRGAADRNGNGEVTLTEAFDYAKEHTIHDTTTATPETQRPSYAVNLRGRRDLVLAQVAASPSTLSMWQSEGPLELIHAESGLTLLELPAGPRRVKLAVPPGAYLVRKRVAAGNLIKEIVVAAGATNVIAEEQLTLVGQARLAAKGQAAAGMAPAAASIPASLVHRPPPPAPEPAPGPPTPRWVKGAAVGLVVASALSFGMSFKFASDVNDINADLDPYRRFDCNGVASSCNPGGEMVPPPTRAEQDYVAALQREGKRYENYQYVSLGATAVFAVASLPFIYKWATGGEGAAEQPVALAPAVGRGGGGLSARLRF